MINSFIQMVFPGNIKGKKICQTKLDIEKHDRLTVLHSVWNHLDPQGLR